VLKLNRPSHRNDSAPAKRSKFMTAASARSDELSLFSSPLLWLSACEHTELLAPSTASPRLWFALRISPGLPRDSARDGASGCTNLLAEGGHVLGRAMRAERSRVLELSACDENVRIRGETSPRMKKPGVIYDEIAAPRAAEGK
jgi:hypothetical protein